LRVSFSSSRALSSSGATITPPLAPPKGTSITCVCIPSSSGSHQHSTCTAICSTARAHQPLQCGFGQPRHGNSDKAA
jgi:hypothetical protein